MTGPDCPYAAQFHSYQERRVRTVPGALRVRRASYSCGRCRQSFLPDDEALGRIDEISPGLMPRVCWAGTRLPFADAAPDLLRRCAGVRVSPSTVLRDTAGEGTRLQAQLKEGRMVEPTPPEPKWRGPRDAGPPGAYVGLDAFRVPMQGIGAAQAEQRLRDTAWRYTPGKEHTRSLVDLELDTLAAQVRSQARALGIARVSDLIARTDGGNGLAAALPRHRAEDVRPILDWYHAAEHVCDFATVWHSRDDAARAAWQEQAQGILDEQGGAALLAHLGALDLPPGTSPAVRAELRKLIGSFENNRQRTDYPAYRQQGWDIGSGPTEAGCKIIGERWKGSGMRWSADGSAPVAALRALYVSGGKVWDGFWSQPRRRVR